MHLASRWQQRFQNFEKAFLLLRDALDEVSQLSQLEKEGLIQRFEYTFELAWKTLADYLNSQGIEITENTPRMVIKAAFKAKVIQDGEAWIQMLLGRNTMSHQYNFEKFEIVIDDLRSSYFSLLDDFYSYFKDKVKND